MKRTIANFALSALTLLPAGVFADLIFEHDDHTYKLVVSPATWDDAKASAEAMSLGGNAGYLARIDSEDENGAIIAALVEHLIPAQLANTIPNDGSEAPFVWLGGSDADVEGSWAWTNNSDLFWRGDFNGSSVGGRYSNWGLQPDNAGGAENALAIGMADWPEPFYDLGAAGQWNDLEEGNALFYLVEFDTTVEPMRLVLNEPFIGGVHTGVGMIRGWALSPEGVERLEVFIDGQYGFDIPYGDPRADIGEAFSEIENSATAGFSVPFNYSALSTGEHTITVVATDAFGDSIERSASFDVVRFDKPYISKEEAPDMRWSLVSGYADYISITGAQVGGKSYNIRLQWQARTQTFEIIDISPQ